MSTCSTGICFLLLVALWLASLKQVCHDTNLGGAYRADAPIARAWSEIVDDKRRTLFYDKGRLKAQVRFLQGFTRNIVSIVKNDGGV